MDPTPIFRKVENGFGINRLLKKVFYLCKQNELIMPMKKGYSRKSSGSGSAMGMRKGPGVKPKQAVAIALSVARKAKAAGSRKRGRKTA